MAAVAAHAILAPRASTGSLAHWLTLVHWLLANQVLLHCTRAKASAQLLVSCRKYLTAQTHQQATHSASSPSAICTCAGAMVPHTGHTACTAMLDAGNHLTLTTLYPVHAWSPMALHDEAPPPGHTITAHAYFSELGDTHSEPVSSSGHRGPYSEELLNLQSHL